MMRRRAAILAVGAAALVPRASVAQATGMMPVVGILGLGVEERSGYLREGLRKLGYTEGRNIRFEERVVGDRYERLVEVANEFVQMKVNVIAALGSTAVQVAAKATSTIPIVMVSGLDPVKAGFAASLARPGGNVTGVSNIIQETAPKRLALTKEAVPGLRRVGVLWNPDSQGSVNSLAATRDAAAALGLGLMVVEARSESDFDSAFAALAKERVRVFLVMAASMFALHRKRLLASAVSHGVAGVFSAPDVHDDGALLAFGTSGSEPYRRMATYVDKILKGTKPGDIAIEQPAEFELVVNLRTAAAVGIKVPQSLLLQAHRVIR